MGHRHDRPRKLGQMTLQPGHRLGVQVVGRLIQQEQVRLLQEHPAEGDAPPLTAGEGRHIGVARWEPKGVHGDVDLPVQFPGADRLDPVLQLPLLFQEPVHLVVVHRLGELHADGLELGEHRPDGSHRRLDVAPHVLGGIQLGLLRDMADPDAFGRPRLAQEILVLARHDPEQTALAGAVGAEDTDFGAGIEREIDPLQDRTARGDDLPEVLHRKDVLVVRHGRENTIHCPRCTPG